MRMPMLLLPAMLVAACETSNTATPDPDPIGPDRTQWANDLSGLLGEWVDEQGENGTVFHEQWRSDGEKALQGLGFVMSGNDTIFIEELAIRWDDQGVTYSARIPSGGQGEFVDFRMNTDTTDPLVFLNPDHDYPQRIVYRMLDDGTWELHVSGTEPDGSIREERYHLRPRNTDPPSTG